MAEYMIKFRNSSKMEISSDKAKLEGQATKDGDILFENINGSFKPIGVFYKGCWNDPEYLLG